MNKKLANQQYFYVGLNPRFKVLGWPNGSGDSLQSCYIWVQFPSPALLDTSSAYGNEPKYLFSFSEEFEFVHFGDIFIACFDEFFGFFDVFRCFADVVVVFEGYELGVD